jgi:hypothetical protein
MVHVEQGDGADRAITQPQIICASIDDHTLGIADLLGGLLSLGEVASADQQGDVGMRRAQCAGCLVADGAGAAHEQNGMKWHESSSFFLD